MKSQKEIAQRLRDLVIREGMTKYQVSNKTGLAYRTIFAAMRGNECVRDVTLAKIAKAVRAPVRYVIHGTGPDQIPEDDNGCADAPRDMTVAQAIRVLARQLDLDEDYIWRCVQQAREKKDKVAPDAGGESRMASA